MDDSGPARLTGIESLADLVRACRQGVPVVGVSGFGGAGKSTVADRLQKQLTGSLVIPGDEFLLERPPTRRCDDWSVVDRNRLRRQVLEPARRGADVRYQVWDPVARALGRWVHVDEPSVVIVEGLGLYVPDLNGLFDLRIWIDVGLDTATTRGMWRDKHVYGNAQTDLWSDVWKPNDADFFSRFRPDQSVDVLFLPPEPSA